MGQEKRWAEVEKTLNSRSQARVMADMRVSGRRVNNRVQSRGAFDSDVANFVSAKTCRHEKYLFNLVTLTSKVTSKVIPIISHRCSFVFLVILHAFCGPNQSNQGNQRH